MALAPQMYRCSFPGCPVPVSIHISLIDALQEIVRNEGGDRQGMLYGQPGESGTVVAGSHALAVFGMEEMRTAVAEAHGPVVGYYRIRDGNSLELSPEEINLAETLFSSPGSVILLVERRVGCPEANFFFLEHGTFMNFPLLEFPLDSRMLTEREAQRVRRIDSEAVVPYAPEVAPAGSGDNEPASAKRPSARWGMIAIVLLVAAASFSAALFLYRPHNRVSNEGATRTAAPEVRASLRAERQGDDVKILWDLNSPAVAGATSGILDIDDGGTPRRILMTADQVRFGSVLYSPVSEQISVRLTMLKDDQSTAQESVLVLLQRPPQPPPAGNGQPRPRVPFEVKTQRLPSSRAAGSREEARGSTEHKALPPFQPTQERVDPAAPTPVVSAAPSAAIAAPRNEPVKPTTQPTSEHVDPAVQTVASASPPPVVTAPRSEPVKPTTQPNPAHVESPTVVSASVPPAAAPRSEPVKPTTQTTPLRVDSPAPQPPATAARRNEPVKPREEDYVAPVLIDQQGVRTPRELLPILTRSVTVNVRVEVDAAGRVTHAEAIPEKGIHSLLLSAAQDAARRCRFRPARRGQSPVSSTVTMVFHIPPAN
jgi:hypothetical protein